MILLTSGSDPGWDLWIVPLSYLILPKEDLLNCLCSQCYPEVVRWMRTALAVNFQWFFWATRLVCVDIPEWGIAYFGCAIIYTEPHKDAPLFPTVSLFHAFLPLLSFWEVWPIPVLSTSTFLKGLGWGGGSLDIYLAHTLESFHFSVDMFSSFRPKPHHP